jgi:hypothetical protein
MAVVLHQAGQRVASPCDHAVGEVDVCAAVQSSHEEDGARLGGSVLVEVVGGGAAGWGQPPIGGNPGRKPFFAPNSRLIPATARLSPQTRSRSARDRQHHRLIQRRQTTAPGGICPKHRRRTPGTSSSLILSFGTDSKDKG